MEFTNNIYIHICPLSNYSLPMLEEGYAEQKIKKYFLNIQKSTILQKSTLFKKVLFEYSKKYFTQKSTKKSTFFFKTFFYSKSTFLSTQKSTLLQKLLKKA